ncbi:MAG: chromosomal replication initiator protein DnaA [Planctomycetes bacterium]|nr:chromosomal replication initiator protein DnaA [Planctomycetota bacterium]
MKTTEREIWTKVLDAIEEQVDPERFHLWFRNTELVSLSDDLVEVGVPSLFIAEWMERHYAATIVEAISRLMSTSPAVKFPVVGHLFAGLRDKQRKDMGSLARKTSEANWTPSIRPDFRLANFVVGPCNEFAHAAAMKVIEAGHTLFNPLFLYGGVGLGKSHILQGMWHEFRTRKPNRKAVYVSAEKFMNEYVVALRHSQLDGFRHAYRTADLLLIDDVHFLQSKMGFQEEFLHTYNALDATDKQVVMASDAHPNEIQKIKATLRSRFVSGLVVKLEPPGLEMRIRILKVKAARLGKRIRRDVLEYIAGRCPGNVRQLEGALTTLVAYASLHTSGISLDMAREVLSAAKRQEKREITIEKIEAIVSRHYHVSRQDMRSKRRTSSISLARQVCMYLARKHTGLSLKEIGGFFAKNHTTVLSASKKIGGLIERDPILKQNIEAIESALVS